MTAKKSIYSVYDATKIAYAKLDNRFSALHLCQMVRHITGRAYLMDGTILRRLRELREDHPQEFNYIVIDNEKSIYKKLNTEKQNGQIQFHNQASPCM